MTGLNHRSTGLMAAIAAGLTLLTAACQAADSNGVRTVSNPEQLRSALRGAAEIGRASCRERV